MNTISADNFSETVNFLWSVADLIRDKFARSDYKDVILPFTVLRRIDCVLQPTKKDVLKMHEELKQKGIKNIAPQLQKISGYVFFNTSPYDFERLLDDHTQLADNLRHYISGFSENMREVLENFGFNNTISKLQQTGILYRVVEKFKNVELHPDKVPNEAMGYIFEELIRRYNEALNENPGEHFTPREVIRLMTRLLLMRDLQWLETPHISRTIYDPCCGSGGMLIITKDHIEEFNKEANIYLYGQEVNPETFAICKSDLYMKSRNGRDAEHIVCGDVLSDDLLADNKFDYILSNPPYGKEWKGVQEAVDAEYERREKGRFGAGLPRISDGQLLFLQHMISHMKEPEDGGSRIAIVMNGSPLFTGDAGSGESEIRRWILEHDLLESIIALPEQIFYNTGITTYIWVLSNRKEEYQQGKVQLINASSEGFWKQMQKSLGNKRRQIMPNQISDIASIYYGFDEGQHAKLFKTTDFGYRKITIERPLRLNFQVNEERVARLREQKAFHDLAVSKKKKGQATLFDVADGQSGARKQQVIIDMLHTLPNTLYKDRAIFEQELAAAAKQGMLDLSPQLTKALLAALGERDESAAICYDKNGEPEADPELRDSENVPLDEDIDAYFAREVQPHVPDAWINHKIRDHKDDNVGKVGYEINFNRYFYQYQPPRPLEAIEADIKALEKDILEMLREVAG